MTMESLVFDALKTLVSNRVYPDIAPDLVTIPYITYHQIGGQSVNFYDGAVPSKRNGEFQINVWAGTRAQASALANQVEDALRGVAALQTEVKSAQLATYDEETKQRGTMQDFSFWY